MFTVNGRKCNENKQPIKILSAYLYYIDVFATVHLAYEMEINYKTVFIQVEKYAFVRIRITSRHKIILLYGLTCVRGSGQREVWKHRKDN